VAFTFKHGDRPLDGYVIQRGVGRGGFGEVYYAISDGGREVALKYLRDHPEVELRGVQNCINLKSPYLVSIFDVKKSQDDEYFIVMEYVAGPSLRDLMASEPKGMGVAKAAYFIREIGKGLSYLHERGVVHRDLKPGNIFYEDGYAKIGDYGLSKFISVSRHSAQTASVGTVHYMAPEIGSGNYSRTIDIYALGVMLYEMLLGKVPFQGSSMGEVLMKHLTEQPEVNDLPDPFGHVIRKALAKDPNDRYQTVEEMVSEIFGVEDVQASVVGFNPTSLSGVVKRVERDLANSPVPSPNPARTPGFGLNFPPPPPQVTPRKASANVADYSGLDARLAARIHKFEGKVESKLAKLDKRNPKRRRQEEKARDQIPKQPNQGERWPRLMLSFMIAVGFAVGLGIIADTGDPGAGVASFLLMGGMSLGLMVSPRIIQWMKTSGRPRWVQGGIQAACVFPFILPGAGLLVGSARWPQDLAFNACIAILLSALFVNWQERLRHGYSGEVRVGKAFMAGFFCWVAGVIVGRAGFDLAANQYTLIAGGIVGAVSMIIESLGAMVSRKHLFPALAAVDPQRTGSPDDRAKTAPVRKDGGDDRDAKKWSETMTAPYGAEMPTPNASQPVEQTASNEPDLRLMRFGITRMFWALAAFMLLGASVTCFVYSIVGANVPDDHAALISVIVGAFCFMLYAISKTTIYRRPTIWRETVRPFGLAMFATILGTSIAHVSVFGGPESRSYWNGRLYDGLASDEFVLAIVGIVMSSIMLIALFFAKGKKGSRRAFLVDSIQSDQVRASAGERIGSSAN
jgi:serine/threonine protein kinase